MDTLISKIDVDNIDMEEIKKQAEILRAGETVIFPTETVYGLGANALDEEAVSKIYKAKGRPSDNPLIVHIGDKKQVYNLFLNTCLLFLSSTTTMIIFIVLFFIIIK